MIERYALAAIGTSIDAIKEFEPPPEESGAPTRVDSRFTPSRSR